MKSALPAAVTLFVYAIGLLFVGGVTWYVAPPGVTATTALVVSGAGAVLAVVCVVLLLQFESSRARGLLGFYLGLVLLIALAIGAGMRLKGSLARTSEFNQEVRRGPVTVVTQTRENKDSPIHPVAYQAVGIAATVTLSIFALVALAMQKPRPGPQARSEPVGLPPEPAPALSAVAPSSTTAPSA